nr:hypothetical protein [Tanacetum cinerariifolium]
MTASLVNCDAVNPPNLLWASLSRLLLTPSPESLTSSLEHFDVVTRICDAVSTHNGENLDKMKEKGDACIFVGYATQSKGYIVYNKRTRLIVKTIHVNFDESPQMVSDHDSSCPTPQCQDKVSEDNTLGPEPQSQENVPIADMTEIASLKELENLFVLMFDEYVNGATQVVSKSFDVTTVDAFSKRQQLNTTPSTSTTVVVDINQLDIQTTPKPTTQAPMSLLIRTSIKQKIDHPLEKVFRNPLQPVRTRQQLDTNGKMYMFALTVSQTKPKNIKEAMVDHAWIEAIQEELHQFEQLDVWELVDIPYDKMLSTRNGCGKTNVMKRTQ